MHCCWIYNRGKSVHLKSIRRYPSTRRRFCFVAWRTNLKDTSATQKNCILQLKQSMKPFNCVQMNISLLVFLTLCPIQRKPVCQFKEFVFVINLTCTKLKHINVVNNYSIVIFKTGKILILMQHKIGQRKDSSQRLNCALVIKTLWV